MKSTPNFVSSSSRHWETSEGGVRTATGPCPAEGTPSGPCPLRWSFRGPPRRREPARRSAAGPGKPFRSDTSTGRCSANDQEHRSNSRISLMRAVFHPQLPGAGVPAAGTVHLRERGLFINVKAGCRVSHWPGGRQKAGRGRRVASRGGWRPVAPVARQPFPRHGRFSGAQVPAY